MFAVTAVLPLQFNRSHSLAFEVEDSEKVTAVVTLDGTLSRSEESSFVLRTEYSHLGSSLDGQMTVQVVLGTKHDMASRGDTDLQMKINGKRFAGSSID